MEVSGQVGIRCARQVNRVPIDAYGCFFWFFFACVQYNRLLYVADSVSEVRNSLSLRVGGKVANIYVRTCSTKGV